MNLTTSDIEAIRSALAVAKTAGIDAVVIHEAQVRGITPSSKMAIISPINLTIDDKVKLGIGRIGELEKRLQIFSGEITGECKLNDKMEVTVLNLAAGRSKVQFRCTAERLIKYPKAIEDPAVATIKANKAEVAQIARAVKTLAAENFTIAVGRDGAVKIECSSPTNEVFSTQLTLDAEFADAAQGIVNIYEGDRLATVLDAAARDSDETELVIGELGSITLLLKGSVIVALPDANKEGDDDE